MTLFLIARDVSIESIAERRFLRRFEDHEGSIVREGVEGYYFHIPPTPKVKDS
jgi:hypothetical protein